MKCLFLKLLFLRKEHLIFISMKKCFHRNEEYLQYYVNTFSNEMKHYEV